MGAAARGGTSAASRDCACGRGRRALEAAARGLAALADENEALRADLAAMVTRIEALERQPDLTSIVRGLDKVDKLADTLQRTLLHSERRLDDGLPLSPLSH